MTDDKKFPRGEVSPEQEDALENVSGGKVQFKTPVYDPEDKEFSCPVCNHSIIDNSINGTADRLQCPGCGRWFRVKGSTIWEE